MHLMFERDRICEDGNKLVIQAAISCIEYKLRHATGHLDVEEGNELGYRRGRDDDSVEQVPRTAAPSRVQVVMEACCAW